MGTLAFHCDFFLLCLRSSQRSSCLAMWADTLLILFISTCTALLGEGVTWVLVYRTEKYQKLKSEIEKQSKKLEMKSMFAIGFAFTALLSMFNTIFDGRVVAKLPFTPIYWIQGLSHRNLLGDDMTDSGFIFLYILCTMSIRQNIQKALGFAPSRSASKQAGSMWNPDPNKYKWN